MEIQRKSLWFENVGKTALREEALYNEELIAFKSLYSFISKGTETLVLNGLVPRELHEVMKVNHMQGSFAFPINYGYSIVGEILSGNNKGQFAHVMAPHATHHLLSENELFVLPSKIDLKQAALLSNIETIINGIWDAELTDNSAILIVGYGGIGQLLGKALQHLGYYFEVFDPQFAEYAVLENLKKNHYTHVFHCSATEQGLQLAIDSAGIEGSIIEMSWYGTKTVSLQLGTSFHYCRKKIISSQVSQIPLRMKNEWNYLKRKELALKWLLEGAFDSIVFNEIAFSQAPSWFEQELSQEGNAFNVIKY